MSGFTRSVLWGSAVALTRRNRKTDAERNIFHPLLLQIKSDIRVCNDQKGIKDAKKPRGFLTCAVSHPFDELGTSSPLADAGPHDRQPIHRPRILQHGSIRAEGVQGSWFGIRENPGWRSVLQRPEPPQL